MTYAANPVPGRPGRHPIMAAHCHQFVPMRLLTRDRLGTYMEPEIGKGQRDIVCWEALSETNKVVMIHAIAQAGIQRPDLIHGLATPKGGLLRYELAAHDHASQVERVASNCSVGYAIR